MEIKEFELKNIESNLSKFLKETQKENTTENRMYLIGMAATARFLISDEKIQETVAKIDKWVFSTQAEREF